MSTVLDDIIERIDDMGYPCYEGDIESINDEFTAYDTFVCVVESEGKYEHEGDGAAQADVEKTIEIQVYVKTAESQTAWAEARAIRDMIIDQINSYLWGSDQMRVVIDRWARNNLEGDLSYASYNITCTYMEYAT